MVEEKQRIQCSFFLSAITGGFSLDAEWQQVSLDLHVSS